MKLKQVWVGDEPLLQRPSTVLVDTGTTLTLAPANALRQLAVLSGASPRPDRSDLFAIPCSAALSQTMPLIKLVLEGRGAGEHFVFTLRPEHYILQDSFSALAGKEPQCMLGFAGHSRVATGGQAPQAESASNSDAWILGCISMMQCTLAFDAKKPSVGFAALKPPLEDKAVEDGRATPKHHLRIASRSSSSVFAQNPAGLVSLGLAMCCLASACRYRLLRRGPPPHWPRHRGNNADRAARSPG